MASLSQRRADAREIFFAGLQSVDPLQAVLSHLELRKNLLRVGGRIYNLSKIRNLYVVGAGKAAARMGLAVERLLGDRIASGIVVVKYGYRLPLQKIALIEAAHPIPDQAGLDAARRVAELARRCGENDLLIVLISGGGSALLAYPVDGVSLEDEQRTTDLLLKSGAPIQDINALRKHISQLKGGRLAALAAPAQVVALILSDVVGDSLEVVASGPTVPDSTTFNECLKIIQRYDLGWRIPAAIIDCLESGARGELAETPKVSDTIFKNVQNLIIGNNHLALMAAQRRAHALGYRTEILSHAVTGESRAVARSHAALAKELLHKNKSAFRPVCFISGGETTVTVCGEGRGGRNQEFALAAAIEIDGLANVVILSGGTDGTDGLTDAAGGIVDGSTLARGRARSFDAALFLEQNDSYHFLQATEDLVVTGPTFTNVMDLQIMLIG
ncbi:MAG: glycerate kinase type-2 family protein [Chloroflexota bacterium]